MVCAVGCRTHARAKGRDSLLDSGSRGLLFEPPWGTTGRVTLADEAVEFEVSMPKSDRLSNDIDWIDVSFVERDRTPRWAIEVGIRCHLSGMSLRYTSQFFEDLGVQRSHVPIHN